MNERFAPPGIGDNKPDTEARLSLAYFSMLQEVEALRAEAKAAPKAVKSDADIETIGAIVLKARDLSRRLKDAHKTEKEPFLREGQTVDGFFREPQTVATDVIKRLPERVDAYKERLAQEERARAQAEARRLQEEEARRIEAARKAEEDGRLAQAAKHTVAAQQAEAAREEAEIRAAAPLAAQPIATTTTGGFRSTVKAVWKAEIVSLQAVRAELGPLGPYLKAEAIQSAIDLFVKQGGRELAGVRITEGVKSTFR